MPEIPTLREDAPHLRHLIVVTWSVGSSVHALREDETKRQSEGESMAASERTTDGEESGSVPTRVTPNQNSSRSTKRTHNIDIWEAESEAESDTLHKIDAARA